MASISLNSEIPFISPFLPLNPTHIEFIPPTPTSTPPPPLSLFKHQPKRKFLCHPQEHYYVIFLFLFKSLNLHHYHSIHSHSPLLPHFYSLLLSTSLLLLSLLRLGSTQKTDSSIHNCKCDVGPTTQHDPKPNPDKIYDVSFVGAPLEVIHEEYYEDEEGIALMMYYPDTDTDSFSGEDSPVIGNWDSPENLCFRWDEEDKEGLIEIELDGKRISSEAEEENLIEIDLTPVR